MKPYTFKVRDLLSGKSFSCTVRARNSNAAREIIEQMFAKGFEIERRIIAMKPLKTEKA